jgi:hypothetical protein
MSIVFIQNKGGSTVQVRLPKRCSTSTWRAVTSLFLFTNVMGRCWCVDSAQEMANILYRVEDMDPYELYITWNLIETLKKFK